MKDEIFAELLENVREEGAILRSEKPASRMFAYNIQPVDVKHIRETFKLSQSEFAAVLSIRVKTLQNWEQSRRAPQGPARVLLQVAARHPEAVWDVVRSP
jgi:putative transcriptional regulator